MQTEQADGYKRRRQACSPRHPVQTAPTNRIGQQQRIRTPLRATSVTRSGQSGSGKASAWIPPAVPHRETDLCTMPDIDQWERFHLDGGAYPGWLSSVVSGPSPVSSKKTASSSAGSVVLAFSLIVWCAPGDSFHVSPA